jgi:hypothetical protein
MQRHDDDRPHIALFELRPNRLQRRIGDRVRDEHRFTRFEDAPQLRITIDVDDEIPDAGILVARDQADLVLLTRQEDGAAIETERVADPAGDRLKDVDEMQRGRDFLQQLDDRDEMIALALNLSEARPQLRDFVRTLPDVQRLRRDRRRRFALVDHSRMCAR